MKMSFVGCYNNTNVICLSLNTEYDVYMVPDSQNSLIIEEANISSIYNIEGIFQRVFVTMSAPILRCSSLFLVELQSTLFFTQLILISAGCVWSGFGYSLKNYTNQLRNRFDSLLARFNNSELESLNNSLSHYDHQVAGHEYSYFGATTRIGMMRESEGYLLKPAIDPKYGPREISFYERLNTTQDAELEKLKEFMPNYYGTTSVKLYGENITFIRMEDMTKGFQLPCVMDLKIGQQTWEPNAKINKILKDSLMSPAMKTVWKFSITGLKYYDVEKKIFVEHDKMYYIKRLFFHEVIRELYNFVNGEPGIECGLVNSMLQQLRRMRSWFQRQKQLLFFDTSILFAYDAQPLLSAPTTLVNDTDGGADLGHLQRHCQSNSTMEVRVRMIDFAHAIPNTDESQVDVNYLSSLDSLIDVFENLSTMYADAYTNGMWMRILQIFSLNELYLFCNKRFLAENAVSDKD